MEEINESMEICRKAMNGDEGAEDELDLQSVQVTMPKKTKQTKSLLQQEFTAALTLAMAARKLKRTLLESQCLQTIKYISLIAAGQGVKLQDTIDGQDVAELMLSILDEMRSCLPSDSALPAATPDSPMAAVPPASAMPAEPNESALAGDSAVLADPPEVSAPAVSALPTAAATTESALAGASTDSALPAAPTESSLAADSGVPADPPEVIAEDSRSEVSKEEITYIGGRNKVHACPLCDFKGTHLSHHLKSQNPDKCMSSKDVTKFVAVSDQKLKVRGTALTTTTAPKATYLYQCGYGGCSCIVQRMGQHLKQAHHITDKNQIKEAKLKFSRLDMPAKRQVQAKPPIPKKIGKKEKPSFVLKVQAPVTQSKSRKRKASSTEQDQPHQKKTPLREMHDEVARIQSEESEEGDESFKSSERSKDDAISDRGELQVEEDLDKISSMAETDEEDSAYYARDDANWEEWYTAKERHEGTAREHFLASFLKYLRHAKGGILSDEQSLIHERQVHKVLEVLDKGGKDVKYLTWKKGLKVWDDFCA